MNCALSKLIPKRQKTSLNIKPIVYEYRPFVGFTFSRNMPFICLKTPSIPERSHDIHNLGFTLIELVVTMAVAAILITVAVPNMRTFIQNGRLNTQVNDLIGDLSLARSEAIKRRTIVGICKSVNGTTCAGGGNWQDGRAIFVDANNNNTWEADEIILRFREKLASGNSLAAASPNPIIFSANGKPIATAVGAFAVCDYRGASKGKQVSLNSIGQASVSAVAPGAC